MPTRDGVLILSVMASFRSDDGWFRTGAISTLCELLRIPEAGNTSAELGRLRDRGRLRTRKSSGVVEWTVTPVGSQDAEELLGVMDNEAIMADLSQSAGADFAYARHDLVPSVFAPVKWRSAIGRLHKRFDFETSVFLMTRFPSRASAEDYKDPVENVVEILRSVVDQHGMTLHLASDRLIDDQLWGNVGGYIWACKYGIGLFETRGRFSDELNDNVLIEVGAMLTLGRRCAILKDVDAPTPPTDLTSHVWKTVDLGDGEAVAQATHVWIREDLGLGPCSDCRTEARR